MLRHVQKNLIATPAHLLLRLLFPAWKCMNVVLCISLHECMHVFMQPAACIAGMSMEISGNTEDESLQKKEKMEEDEE